MPTIRVAIVLPYFLALPAGPYVAPGLGGELHLAVITAGSFHQINEPQTQAWMTFEVSDEENAESQERRRLGQEWPEARDFLKGIDFGLRHKMTTGLRLLTGHSLYAEPDQFWQELSASYNLRNRIIHEEHVAHEDDAKRSIHVARKIVQIVQSQFSKQSH